MRIARLLLTVFLLASIAFILKQERTVASQADASRPASTSSHRLAASMQAKLDHIQQNSKRSTPDQTPTVMTEEEVNDYIASGGIILPQGVKKLSMQGRAGVVTAFLNVDFDEIRAGQKSSNPLLSIFNGTHDVRVEADASGAGGQGKVQVRDVSIDGISVPRMALEYFVGKYITPKYPNIGLDSTFQLPSKIDLAAVGYHKLTVTQK
jgi:ABC-type transporter MlaC component